MIWFYDLEVYKNLFIAVFINFNWDKVEDYIKADIDKDETIKATLIEDGTNSGNIKVFINGSYSELIEFIRTCKMLIGYNNHKYDDILIDYIYKYGRDFDNSPRAEEHIKSTSDYIINSQRDGDKIKDVKAGLGIDRASSAIKALKIISLDLMALNYLDKNKVSLKQVAINIKWHRIQELPYAENSTIMGKQIDEVLDYCFNDVLILTRLYKASESEFRLRTIISRKYNLPVYSSARSKTGDMMFSKFYSDYTGFNYFEFRNLRTYRRKIKFSTLISPKIHFRANSLSEFLRKLIKLEIHVGVEEFKESIIFDGVEYTFALGGLHTVDPPQIFNEDDSKFIIDADVDSYYPAIIVNEGIHPEHLSKTAFVGIVKSMREERLSYKAKKLKDDADSLKISINNIFGKLGFEYGFLYDLKAMYQTTINGQLYLMMLIDMLVDNGFRVISANTDGVVSIVPKDRLSEYNAICKEWCDYTGFTLEFNNYKKYVRLGVNDYYAIYSDSGKIKEKGEFITSVQLDKGYFAPIIAKTIQAYFNDNVNIDKYLRSHGDIYDFCVSQKIGRQYTTEYHSIKNNQMSIEPIQRTLRYYISNRGGVLIKRKIETNSVEKLIAGYNVRVFNNFYPVNNMSEYDINYNFYKRKIMEIVNRCLRNDIKDIRKYGGTLFD